MPTEFSDLPENFSLYLAAAMRYLEISSEMDSNDPVGNDLRRRGLEFLNRADQAVHDAAQKNIDESYD